MTLEELYQIIKYRQQHRPKGSYVADLFESGKDRIIQKVGEEATEVVIAAKNKSKQKLIAETADLWFHSLILLTASGISINEIMTELEKRHTATKR